MLSAGIGIVAALAFVLGLIALSVWVLKRFSGGTINSRSRLPVEVVQRVSLGPKSGLAIVRVGEKVMAVSLGEGGVHALFEVDEADRQRVVAGSEIATPLASSAAAQTAFAASANGATGALTHALSGPLARAFGGSRKASVVPPASVGSLRPFGEALTDALSGAHSERRVDTPFAAHGERPAESRIESPADTPASLQSSSRITVRAVEPRTPRDLRSVLSMTLAPSTRLLSIIAFVVLGVVTSASSVRAQGTGSPTAGQPTAQPTPAAPNAGQPVAAPVVPPQALPTAPPPLNLPPIVPQVGGAAASGNATAATAAPAPNAAQTTQPRPAQASAASAADVSTAEPASVSQTVGGLVPQLDLRLGSGEDSELRLNGTVGVVLMMGLMTLVPTLLLMMTGFTRILIVLHFLKQAMGTQSAPPAHLVAALALLLTGFVMAPTITEANRTAITPWLEGRMEQTEMLKVGVVPFREFMLRQTNEKDLSTFVSMSGIAQPETPDDVPLHVLMSAFVASELRTAFQIGFAIYLPFIVIDAVVASVLMAMGMFMLPPAMISLPFKLLLFVLVDGWSLTIQSLVQSFR